MNRRTILKATGLLAAVLSLPALAEEPKVETATTLPIIWGDGEHCDAAGLEALMNGEQVLTRSSAGMFPPERQKNRNLKTTIHTVNRDLTVYGTPWVRGRVFWTRSIPQGWKVRPVYVNTQF